MILLIDNYDSFSYNLYQLIGKINPDIKVIRNDEYTAKEIEKMNPEYIIISPGPKAPDQAGVCIEVIKRLGGRIPILGICLGHQAICEAFGARISHAKELMHGKQSLIKVDNNSYLFKGMESEIAVARYHSLAALPQTMPDSLRIVAKTDDGEIMAVEHRQYPVYGLQFHPESILTPYGEDILKNFFTNVVQEAL